MSFQNMLKSDLRGIETFFNRFYELYISSLKSDLRGIETPETRIILTLPGYS